MLDDKNGSFKMTLKTHLWMFFLSVFILFSYMELNFFYFFRGTSVFSDFVYRLSSLPILFLPIPVMYFIIYPLFLKLNNYALKNSIIFEITNNTIEANLCLDTSSPPAKTITITENFSSELDIIENVELFKESAKKAIIELRKGKCIFIPSPYVYFSFNKPVAKSQVEYVKRIILGLSVIDAFYVEKSTDIELIKKTIREKM